MRNETLWKAGACLVLALACILASHAGIAPPKALGLMGLAFMGSVSYADIASTAVQDVTETFKRVYLMSVDAVPDATPLSAQMKRTRKFKAGADGLYFRVKLETGGAVANVGDALKLPRATRPKSRQGKATIAHTYTVIAVGGQSIPLTESNRNAFVGNLEEQLEDGLTRVRNDVERQWNGDGRGILCVVTAVAGAPTYTVNNAFGSANWGAGCQLLLEDMDVAGINPANGAERGRSKITTIDFDNNQFTTAAAIAGLQIGDYIVLCNDNTATGTDAVNNYLNEAAGIAAAIQDSGTFENINRTTHRRFRSTVMTNGGTLRPISEKLIASLEARINAKSGKRPNLFYTTRGISIDMQDQLAGLRRFTGETVKLKGGYEGVKIGGRTFIEGDWAPKSNFWAINTEEEACGVMDLVPMGYVDLDGAKLHRIEGRHAWRADLWFPHNIIWFAPNTAGRLGDVQDDTTIVR